MQQIFDAALLLDEVIVIAKPYEPGPPNLISGKTTCYDNYCIRLTGTDFQSDAYVDVRPRNSPGIIASYRGSDLIRGSNGNTDTLQLGITDPTQRNHLNSAGLRFYVVNPGNGWDGPVHIKRRPSCFPFCNPRPCHPFCG
ncbi:MAG: hypothetical protein L3J88_08205, partial [Gammaproteobacteria bacterium]|nr:hypothetical protein [Gammaproteobacteria bacterium]